VDIERYLKAIERRLDKLPVDPNRDRLQTLVIDKLWQQYQAKRAKQSNTRLQQPDWRELPWLIEELRVSLFAQTLGTRVPISEKRVEQAIKALY